MVFCFSGKASYLEILQPFPSGFTFKSTCWPFESSTERVSKVTPYESKNHNAFSAFVFSSFIFLRRCLVPTSVNGLDEFSRTGAQFRQTFRSSIYFIWLARVALSSFNIVLSDSHEFNRASTFCSFSLASVNSENSSKHLFSSSTSACCSATAARSMSASHTFTQRFFFKSSCFFLPLFPWHSLLASEATSAILFSRKEFCKTLNGSSAILFTKFTYNRAPFPFKLCQYTNISWGTSKTSTALSLNNCTPWSTSLLLKVILEANLRLLAITSGYKR